MKKALSPGRELTHEVPSVLWCPSPLCLTCFFSLMSVFLFYLGTFFFFHSFKVLCLCFLFQELHIRLFVITRNVSVSLAQYDLQPALE